MTRPFRYGGIGSGRQGAAAAFFLARWETTEHVLVADGDLEVAERASQRINRLVGREVAVPRRVNVGDTPRLVETLADVAVAVCAVPYSMILTCTRDAIEAGTSIVDRLSAGGMLLPDPNQALHQRAGAPGEDAAADQACPRPGPLNRQPSSRGWRRPLSAWASSWPSSARP